MPRNSCFYLLGLVMGLALSVPSGRAANLTTTVYQNTGEDWTAGIWRDGAGNLVAPVAGNTYELLFNGTRIGNGQNNTRVRSVIGSANATNTFPGDSLKLNTDTELRMKGNSTTQTEYFPGVNGNPGLILNGGLLNIGDQSTIVIGGSMQAVSGTESYICPGNNDIGGFQTGRRGVLNATISGGGTLVLLESPTNTPTVISGNANPFFGKWVVKSGYLSASGTSALGTYSSILVDPQYVVPSNLNDTAIVNQAVLDVGADFNCSGTLTLTNGGQMYLHQNCTFSDVTIGGVSLSTGTHSYAELAGNVSAGRVGQSEGASCRTTSADHYLAARAAKSVCWSDGRFYHFG